MAEVERAQRIEADIDLPEDGMEPVGAAITRAIEWAVARLEAHAAVDRRAFRGTVTLRPRLSARVIAALAEAGAVEIEADGEGLPAGFLAAALRRGC